MGGQTENFIPVPNQSYKIVSAMNPSLGLDCSCNPMNKNSLILWQFNGAANQLWRFVPDNQGNYSIVNVQNGGTLEIPDHSNAQQGVNLLVNQPNNTINEKWRVVPAQGGAKGKGFAIVSAYNQLCADISGGNLNNNTNIILWPNNNQMNQTWCIAPV
jgi:alpha-L-fucosidase 2